MHWDFVMKAQSTIKYDFLKFMRSTATVKFKKSSETVYFAVV